ncbi:hypothetical protein KI387_023229, partial [Taxus chinensis]
YCCRSVKMDKLNHIEKFDGKDFHTWKFRTQLVLINKDLWEIVDDKTKKPSDADEAEKWESKDRK